MKEIWKRHYTGLLLSNFGQVFIPKSGIKQEHYTYGSLKPNGYFYIRYNKKPHYVHDLVYETFNNISTKGLHVHHINGNTADNRLENLVLLTQEEHNKIHGRGSKPVLQYDLNGNFIKEWPSAGEIQRQLGFSQAHIYKCCKNKLHYNTAYGFVWKFKTE